MKKSLLPFAAAALLAAPAFADNPQKLTVKIDGVEQGKPIPSKFAYCMPDGKGRMQDGGNISPAISWEGAPPETKSYALIMVDRDVPASFDLANQSGKIIPVDFLRRDFYHWVVADIPATTTSIAEGASSQRVVMGGKPAGKASYGTEGINDYGEAFGGAYGGYDGPCPPWNDMRLHHYHFIVYALNVATLGLKDKFNGDQALKAITAHTITSAEAMGTYTNRTDLKQ